MMALKGSLVRSGVTKETAEMMVSGKIGNAGRTVVKGLQP